MSKRRKLGLVKALAIRARPGAWPNSSGTLLAAEAEDLIVSGRRDQMTNNSRVAHVFLALSSLLVVLAIGCSSSNPTSPGSTAAVNTSSATSPGSGSTGTLTVMLKDLPFDAKALLVSFTEVKAHLVDTSGGHWMTLSGQNVTCDLAQLEHVEEVLAGGSLPAGHYTQLRLVAATAAIYFDKPWVSSSPCVVGTVVAPDGDMDWVTVPPDPIILNRQFVLDQGTKMTITLDFDGAKSIHKTGNGTYMMKPVISVVSEVVQP
jgi:hypothetical protein